MTLDELLEHTKVAYLDQVSSQISGASDALFSDETITRFLNEGERILCARSWVLQSLYSVTKPHTFVTLQTGVKDYVLHKSVLFVLSAKLPDTDLDLVRIGYEDSRPRSWMWFPDYFDVNLPYTDTPGRPQWFATDVGVRTIRFRPAPSSVENGMVVQMRVVHTPIQQLSTNDRGKSPEIPEDYHETLCSYAAAKCLMLPNIDSGLSARAFARDYLAEFNGKVREAHRDVMRLQYSMPQFRFGGWASDDRQ